MRRDGKIKTNNLIQEINLSMYLKKKKRTNIACIITCTRVSNYHTRNETYLAEYFLQLWSQMLRIVIIKPLITKDYKPHGVIHLHYLAAACYKYHQTLTNTTSMAALCSREAVLRTIFHMLFSTNVYGSYFAYPLKKPLYKLGCQSEGA